MNKCPCVSCICLPICKSSMKKNSMYLSCVNLSKKCSLIKNYLKTHTRSYGFDANRVHSFYDSIMLTPKQNGANNGQS